MISVLLSRLVLLVFGILYPAYASYKTVKTKNVRDYVKWMMYWIVFALYTCIEIFTDIFIAFWFPFYYELKIAFLFWLICPATRGSTYIFKTIINPQLSKHEPMLDAYIGSLWDQGYDVLRNIGARGADYLGHFILELLRKGQITAATYLPKLNEISQIYPVTETCINSVAPNNLDTALEVEDFDILMMDNPEFYKNNVAAVSSKVHPEESQDSDTDSPHSEDLKSVKKRPLRLAAAKNKEKVSGLRERKKKNTN